MWSIDLLSGWEIEFNSLIPPSLFITILASFCLSHSGAMVPLAIIPGLRFGPWLFVVSHLLRLLENATLVSLQTTSDPLVVECVIQL